MVCSTSKRWLRHPRRHEKVASVPGQLLAAAFWSLQRGRKHIRRKHIRQDARAEEVSLCRWIICLQGCSVIAENLKASQDEDGVGLCHISEDHLVRV